MMMNDDDLVLHSYTTKQAGQEHEFDFETTSVVKKVRNNFNSDAAHVSLTFYNLIKNSRKHQKLRTKKKKRFRSDIVNTSSNPTA